MPSLSCQHAPELTIEDDLLAHGEQLEWLLRPIPRAGTPTDRDGGLVFHAFQSMSQTWSRSSA
ncbi:hypothetical protein OHS33_29390 [Streptomyces sp. NBC_00536]|uniref:hypothetical protein n=1 Tax=Streptomyces sp. NBC_00536 TaxID=2975769 RepID=UPI002E80C16B|nr:hypothetical protein [Streptomyces sp. NBC_00536]WUC82103.1 hypothetical protein OHS33_29390 [Streptomyces sp. NBC_00536]